MSKSDLIAKMWKRGLVVSVAGVLAACQSAPPQDQMAKTTTDTAPADLQLLCANAAATTAKVEASKILPLSSAKIDDKTYSVELDASGTKYVCMVDTAGTVKSVGPAPAAPAAQ